MKHNTRLRFWLCFALLASLTFVIALPAGAARPKFVGSWASIDFDGSRQRMTVSGGGRGEENFYYFDHGASACGIDSEGNILYPAKGRGTAVANGDELVSTADYWCLSRPPSFLASLQSSFIYHDASDTLSQFVPGWGTTTWHRSGKQ